MLTDTAKQVLSLSFYRGGTEARSEGEGTWPQFHQGKIQPGLPVRGLITEPGPLDTLLTTQVVQIEGLAGWTGPCGILTPFLAWSRAWCTSPCALG